MFRVLFASLFLFNVAFAQTPTVNGDELLAKANDVLATLTSDYILNVEACVNNEGQIQVIYSSDFRSSIAYVYDSEMQDFNEAIPYEQLNITYGNVIENQGLIAIFKAKLGLVDLVCARNLIVLE